MQRAFAMISIVILLFMQSTPATMQFISATTEDDNQFSVNVDNDSTLEKATIEIDSLLEENYDSINVHLPEKSTYDDELTQELEQTVSDIAYNKQNHSITVTWDEDEKQNVALILTDLGDTHNSLIIQGMLSDEIDIEEKHEFQVMVFQEDKGNYEGNNNSNDDIAEENNNDSVPENNETSNTKGAEKDENAPDESDVSDKSQGSAKEETNNNSDESEIKEKQEITNNNTAVQQDETNDDQENIGDLNTYIGIGPVFETALSGADADFRLTLKLTGAKRTYKNVDVVVDLPLTEYVTFDDSDDNLDRLSIGGVSPTFDGESNQLIYHFDEIKRGQMYEKIISLNTKNGYIPNNTSLEVEASINGEVHYTENDEKEEAEKGDVVPFEYEDKGSMNITASGALSLSKFQTDESENNKNNGTIVNRGDTVLWKLELEIPKKERGQLFLNPDEKITITDTLPDQLNYEDVVSGDEPSSVDGQTLAWEFSVDDFEVQEEKGKTLAKKDIIIETTVKNNAAKGEVINNAEASATFIEDKQVTDDASRSVLIAIDDPGSGEMEGTVFVPNHFGPDGDSDNKNPNPTVTDDAELSFKHGIAPLNESFPDRSGKDLGVPKNFQAYQTLYEIDDNLNLETLRAPGKFRFNPNEAYQPKDEYFKEQPQYAIKAKINGDNSYVTLIVADDVIHGKTYTREELGLDSGDKVNEIRLEFIKGYNGNPNDVAPGGMQAATLPQYTFSIDQGYIGQIENKFNVTGINGNGERFNDRNKNPDRYDNSTDSDVSGPRQATVVGYGENPEPVGRVGVKLLEDINSVVTLGKNRMQVELENVNNSGAPMNESLETVVLLPPGVTLHDDVNPSYTNAKGDLTDAGSYEVLEDDYNGSGRQLVKVKWDDSRITKGQNLQAELDVYVNDQAPNQLTFDVYGFSNDEGLQAPSNTGGGVTDTVLQDDSENFYGNGAEHPRLKSGNIYSLAGKYDVQTEKLIKGPNDEDYSKFTLAPFEGTVDYKLKLTNTTGQDLSIMTLIDVLPTVGDLGITDNVNRGSQFDPILEGPITLPVEWQGKVNVFYSTAKNPERDDLTRHTDYLPNTPQLTNPEGAEAPNWMEESDVADWNTIHSFKIELQKGDTWIKGQDIEIDFSMIMPEEADVGDEVINLDLAPQQRAAWNSFAVATDTGQAVEPERVGVAIETFIDIPVEKVWVGEAQDKVTINLLADGKEVDTIELSEEKGWEHVFEDLPTTDGTNRIDYTIEEVEIDGYDSNIIGNAEEGFVVTNTELTSIPVEKVWEGEEQDKVTINLLADDEVVATIDLSADNDWQHVFEDLPVANSEGAITYTIEEVEIDGYDSNITGNAEDGFVVTNTELTSIPVEKVWEGEEQDEVTINLLADDEVVATIDLSADNDWQHVFEDLPVANSEGAITYTIEEVEIDGYDSNITGNAEEGFVVTNTELTNIPVEKVWEGEAQDEVTINLLADDEIVSTVDLSADNDWQHVFGDLPVANSDGTITYTIEEVAIEGYNSNITGNAEDGFVVINTLNPPETPGIEKEVEDNNGDYGKDLVKKEREKDYNYQVHTVIPDNLLGYEYITIADELDDRLDVIDAVALVDGEEVDYEVIIDGQLVTLKLDREQLDEIAGQNLTLQITAQIKADVEAEVIDNQATIQVNDNPTENSNVVPVTPEDPPEAPAIDKDVEGTDHLDIDYDTEYQYNIITKLPSNIEEYETFVITDTVDKGLDVISDKVTVTVDGESYDGLVLTVDGNDVKVAVTDFSGLEGEEQIELVITAKINSDTNMDDYANNKIPNTATLEFTNESGEEGQIETEPVTVTPPTPEDPGSKLPKTATNTFNLQLIGLGIILVGLLLLFVRRKRI